MQTSTLFHISCGRVGLSSMCDDTMSRGISVTCYQLSIFMIWACVPTPLIENLLQHFTVKIHKIVSSLTNMNNKCLLWCMVVMLAGWIGVTNFSAKLPERWTFLWGHVLGLITWSNSICVGWHKARVRRTKNSFGWVDGWMVMPKIQFFSDFFFFYILQYLFGEYAVERRKQNFLVFTWGSVGL